MLNPVAIYFPTSLSYTSNEIMYLPIPDKLFREDFLFIYPTNGNNRGKGKRDEKISTILYTRVDRYLRIFARICIFFVWGLVIFQSYAFR